VTVISILFASPTLIWSLNSQWFVGELTLQDVYRVGLVRLSHCKKWRISNKYTNNQSVNKSTKSNTGHAICLPGGFPYKKDGLLVGSFYKNR